MKNSKFVKGYIFAITSAVIYGLMPFMAKYIYADGLNPISLVFFRNFLALPVMALLAFLESRTLLVPVKELPKISIISVLGCCITPLLLFTSYNYMDSGVATVFHFIYPAVVIIIGSLFFRQKPNRTTLLSVLICLLGICLFYNPNQPISLLGSVFSLSSGVTFAVYVCLLSNFNNPKVPKFLFSFYVALINSVVLFIICITTNSLILPKTAFGFIMCLTFALLVTAGAVVLFQAGTFIIGGQRTAILSTLEPITSIFIGVLFLKEKITVTTVFGTLLVISSSVLIAVFDIRKQNKSKGEDL